MGCATIASVCVDIGKRKVVLMKIFVLIVDTPIVGNTFEGVFSSLEKVDEYIRRFVSIPSVSEWELEHHEFLDNCLSYWCETAPGVVYHVDEEIVDGVFSDAYFEE